MPFCSSCGHNIANGTKFCTNCGKKIVLASKVINVSEVIKSKNETTTERKHVYDGEIHKCPNCGEILDSFISNCPACGYELRGTNATTSVRELALKLEAIEAKREVKKARSIKDQIYGEEITKTDEQKISLIRSFSIPNTKEDLYEFLILAESNIDIDLYDGTVLKSDARIAVSNAWKAKFEHAYQKAKLLFENDPRWVDIQQLYDNTHKEIKEIRGKLWRQNAIILGMMIVLFAVVLIVFAITGPIQEKKEVARLESIVSEIEIQLENGEYKYALMNADTLVCNGTKADDEQVRKWKIQREYWIDKVIAEAEKNGVKIDYIPHEEFDNDNTSENTSKTSSSDGLWGGFVKGFYDAVQPGIDADKKSVDEFNSIVNSENNESSSSKEGE